MLAFAYSFWTIYGSGEETIAKGFLLLTAGIPVYVYLRWRQSRERVAVETARARSSRPSPPSASSSRPGSERHLHCQHRRAPPGAAAGATVGVHSEVGALRRVLLHRPGAELNRLTPAQQGRPPLRRGALGPPRAPGARRLRRPARRARRRGALPPRAARRGARRPGSAGRGARALAGRPLGTALAAEIGRVARRPRLRPRAGPAPDRRRHVRRAAVRAPARSQPWWAAPTTSSCRRCRTTCSRATRRAWVGGGVAVNAMAKPARRRESVHLAAIYHHHPPSPDGVRALDGRAATPARRSRAATCSCSGAAACSSAWASARRRRLSRRWRCGSSPPARRARCSPSRCPSSARRCTWTPC